MSDEKQLEPLNENQALIKSAIGKGMIQAAPSVGTLKPAASGHVQDVSITAETPDEFETCQSAMIEWFTAKVQELRHDRDELQQALDHAIKCKWSPHVLRRHLDKALKRLEFYEKIQMALAHGYMIVPNFPVTAFAIRTDRKRPMKMVTTHWSQKHTQEAKGLPVGEGDYKNPFPFVAQQSLEPATTTKNEVVKYWANGWKDLEFPISMAKPRIMAAATRAMALKVFDDLAILPGFAPEEGTRPPKGDPIIVARIKDRSRSDVYHSHWISFMVAWNLDTRNL